MATLKIKDDNGNWLDIPAIRGRTPRYRGQHVPGTVYDFYDWVTHGGSSYLYINPVSSTVGLSDNEYWGIIAEGGYRINPRGEWSPDADPLYSRDDLVSFNGGSYLYINDTPSNEPTSSATHWQQIATVGGQDLVDAAVAARDAAQAQAALAQDYAAQLTAGTASPAGTYANLAALNADLSNVDTDRTYVTLDDNKWCYYDTGTSLYVAGGVYLASGMKNFAGFMPLPYELGEGEIGIVSSKAKTIYVDHFDTLNTDAIATTVAGNGSVDISSGQLRVLAPGTADDAAWRYKTPIDFSAHERIAAEFKIDSAYSSQAYPFTLVWESGSTSGIPIKIYANALKRLFVTVDLDDETGYVLNTDGTWKTPYENVYLQLTAETPYIVEFETDPDEFIVRVKSADGTILRESAPFEWTGITIGAWFAGGGKTASGTADIRLNWFQHDRINE